MSLKIVQEVALDLFEQNVGKQKPEMGKIPIAPSGLEMNGYENISFWIIRFKNKSGPPEVKDFRHDSDTSIEEPSDPKKVQF